MKLQSEYPNEMFIPTADILYVWICHMIRTKEFKEDCQKNFQKTVYPLIYTEDSQLHLLKSTLFKNTKFVYETKYKARYLTENYPVHNKHVNFDDNAPVHLYDWLIYPITQVEIDQCESWVNPMLFKEEDLFRDNSLLLRFKKENNDKRLFYKPRLYFKEYEKFLYLSAKYPPQDHLESLQHFQADFHNFISV